jgi:hypothetical protein
VFEENVMWAAVLSIISQFHLLTEQKEQKSQRILCQHHFIEEFMAK